MLDQAKLADELARRADLDGAVASKAVRVLLDYLIERRFAEVVDLLERRKQRRLRALLKEMRLQRDEKPPADSPGARMGWTGKSAKVRLRGDLQPTVEWDDYYED